MLHVAVVEDNDRDAEYLLSHLKRYGRENNMEIEAKRYVNGILFLEQYRGDFDLVFMDIDMPAMNGMNTAKALREMDAHVVLIFVTALARFALNGYEVDAFDFIVKPLQYNFFSAKMSRAVKKLSSEQRVKLLIKSNEKTVRLFADEIVFVGHFQSCSHLPYRAGNCVHPGHHERCAGNVERRQLCSMQQILCSKPASRADD